MTEQVIIMYPHSKTNCLISTVCVLVLQVYHFGDGCLHLHESMRVCECVVVAMTQADTYSRRPVWIALHLGKNQVAGFPVSSHAEQFTRLEDEYKQTNNF